jgi:hypothetical protein
VLGVGWPWGAVSVTNSIDSQEIGSQGRDRFPQEVEEGQERTASIFTLAEYFPISMDERRALLAAKLAVAASGSRMKPSQLRGLAAAMSPAAWAANAPVDSFIDALIRDDVSWRTTLQELAGEVDECRSTLLMIDVCTAPLRSPQTEVDASRFVRRADAVLDLFDTDFSVTDVTAAFDAAQRQVSGEAAGMGDLVGYGKKVAGVVSLFHPLVGLAADGALSLVDRSASEEKVVDQASARLARLVLSCRYAYEEDVRAAEAQRAIVALRKELRDSEGRVTHVERLGRAISILSELAGEPVRPDAESLPDFTGQLVADATRWLKAAGVQHSVLDAIQTRSIWDETNWRVTTVLPTQDEDGLLQNVVVKARKLSDPS